MTLPVIILSAAESDIRKAVTYFDEVRPGHGELFRLEVDWAIGMIRRWPHSHEKISPQLRRFVLRRFPYSLVYRPLRSHIRVVGVVATRRDPDIIAAMDAYRS
ncbi:MAG: type II toxin-antitoxin system RelE/ParE family toxin [Phycisphaerales bacterium]